MEKFSGLKMPDGEPILTQEYINTLQQQAIAKKLKNAIVPQAGGQENMLATNVDILICGGSRGGSKSFSGLMEAQKDILNPDFHAAVFRNNKKAMEKLIRDSRKLFSQFGTTMMTAMMISKRDSKARNMPTLPLTRSHIYLTRNSSTSLPVTVMPTAFATAFGVLVTLTLAHGYVSSLTGGLTKTGISTRNVTERCATVS